MPTDLPDDFRGTRPEPDHRPEHARSDGGWQGMVGFVLLLATIVAVVWLIASGGGC